MNESKRKYNKKYHADNKEAHNERDRTYYENNREREIKRATERHNRLKDTPDYKAKRTRAVLASYDRRVHGVPAALRHVLHVLQSGICAACPTKLEATPSLDHNHETGRIRSLLCRDCNLALGFAHDDPQRLRNLAVYLEKHQLLEVV